jgi:hypothetical protein
MWLDGLDGLGRLAQKSRQPKQSAREIFALQSRLESGSGGRLHLNRKETGCVLPPQILVESRSGSVEVGTVTTCWPTLSVAGV